MQLAVDGTCLDLADTPANDEHFGRPGVNKGERAASELEDSDVHFTVTTRDGDYYLTTNLFDSGWGMQADLVTTDALGKAFEPDAYYENADGTALLGKFNPGEKFYVDFTPAE